jgi:hypothetical protein
MRRLASDRIKSVLKCALLCALALSAFETQGFAQEPPLDVALAGALPSLASGGCELGFAGGLSVNSQTAATAIASSATNASTTSTVSTENNNPINYNQPLYAAPDAGANVPLYGTPIEGENAPLYGAPNPGTNIPLYANTSDYHYGSLSGGFATAGNSPAPVSCRSGIPAGQWLIYPSVHLYSIYSDNFFFAPTGQINTFDFGVTPSVTAQWSNGIHSTTIYANVDTQRFPTYNALDTFDRRANITQEYSPLPDLTFTALGDYQHKTITNSLTNSIPTAVTAPIVQPTLLANGNIQLPNGTIVSPTGQVVGNANGPVTTNGLTLVNPYDQYTGTATVSKIFNRAILALSASAQETAYQFTQNSGSQGAFTTYFSKTFTESAAAWLNPTIYAYTNASLSMRTLGTLVNPHSDAYQVQGGFGTRQIGLLKASIYYGYQGSNADGSTPAGGLQYGGKLSYFPTEPWTVIAAVDTTINRAAFNAPASSQALAVNSPVQIALSSSTRITTPSLQSQYQLSRQWALIENFSYSQIDYYNSVRVDRAWQTDTQLTYEMLRNMTLTWEYAYTAVFSNAPGSSARRNFVLMSADYRF